MSQEVARSLEPSTQFWCFEVLRGNCFWAWQNFRWNRKSHEPLDGDFKPMRWAIVADDLTGAADSAVAFADRGIATTVWLCEPKEFPDGTCCSVDADARWRNEKSAAIAVSEFVRKLRTADWIMLKIDSTLRGFVGAMVKAAWQSSGRKWALIAPAVPKQGRKVVNGKLFVHGRPVTEIDLAKEQPAPVTTPSVMERVRNTGLDKFPLEHLGLEVTKHHNLLTQAIERAAMNGVGLICDAETDRDLTSIVRVAIKASTKPLFVGASGLARALAKVTGGNFVKRKLTFQTKPNRVLVIVGSQQTLAREQLEFLAAKGIPVTKMSGETLPDLPEARISAISLNPDRLLNFVARSRAPDANFLTRFDALVIVGGLTARAIFDALGVKRWDLLGSLLSGMPFGVVQSRNKTLLVTTKAGGFGTKQTLWRAVVRLEKMAL